MHSCHKGSTRPYLRLWWHVGGCQLRKVSASWWYTSSAANLKLQYEFLSVFPPVSKFLSSVYPIWYLGRLDMLLGLLLSPRQGTDFTVDLIWWGLPQLIYEFMKQQFFPCVLRTYWACLELIHCNHHILLQNFSTTLPTLQKYKRWLVHTIFFVFFGLLAGQLSNLVLYSQVKVNISIALQIPV